jgi:ABC-type amino acid transport substrate-binding protein
MSNMVSSLKRGEYDAWISAITITKEREKEIAFSDVYFSGIAKLMATKADTFNATPREIKGKTIGVEAGTSYIPYIKIIYDDFVTIKTFSSGDNLCLALKNGRVDAVIDDETVLKHWRSEQNDRKQYRLIGLPAKHLSLIKQQYAIAVAKNNPNLVMAINRVLAQIKADGTYKKIFDAHF